MPGKQSTTEEIPLLNGPPEKVRKRLLKMRDKLENMFVEIDDATSVQLVCGEALLQQNAGHDSDVAMMLRRYSNSPLAGMMEKLNKMVVKLGGTTAWSQGADSDGGDEVGDITVAVERIIHV